jgi:hypothetical protein
MDVNQSHHAVQYYNSLPDTLKAGPVVHRYVDGLVEVCTRVYNKYGCYNLGAKYKRNEYSYNWFWAKTNSVRATYFYGANRTDSVSTLTTSHYENTAHYQVTKTETTDSKQISRVVRYYYPHEMQVLEPGPIWDSMIVKHQLAEQIVVESTFANGSPDFKQKTNYAVVNGASGDMLLPNSVEFSSGGSALEGDSAMRVTTTAATHLKYAVKRM